MGRRSLAALEHELPPFSGPCVTRLRLKFASFERLERKLIHNLVLTAARCSEFTRAARAHLRAPDSEVRSSGASLAHAPVDLKADKDLVIEDPLALRRCRFLCFWGPRGREAERHGLAVRCRGPEPP